ncbi:TlpA family protein disulfide reductase [Spirosoma oryzicola]|nr:TlpA family protein disulfide reductase [Spirosoma oryzicola]
MGTISSKRIAFLVVCCLVCLHSAAVHAHDTTTVHCLFSQDWEGKQAMLVAKVLYQPPIIVKATVFNRKADFTITLLEPSPAYIWLEGKKEDYQLFIDSPAIYVSFDQTAFVTGSPSSELWAEQLTMLTTNQESEGDLRTELAHAFFDNDSLAIRNLEQLDDSIKTAHTNQIVKQILDHPSSASSWFLFASNHFSYNRTLDLFGKLSAFSSYPSFKRIQAKLAKNQVDTKVTDFTLPTVTGQSFTLSTLKATYILIDFSSRFFAACHKRHNALKQIYRTYHPRGLEIVTVSLEFNSTASRNDMQQENLPWIHVLDLMGPTSISNQFGVEQMPDTILLSADQTVLGRDMSVSEIEATLSRLLKK